MKKYYLAPLLIVLLALIPVMGVSAAIFGKTTIGTHTDGANVANEMECAVFTAPADGSVTSISKYFLNDNTARSWKGVIVDRLTLNILTNGVGNATAGGNNGWATSTFAVPPSITSGTSYALCWVADGSIQWVYDNETGEDFFDATNNYTTPGNPTDGFSNVNNFIGSVYATFGPASSVDQEGFRFRNDDGSESGATWLAAQDTNITQPTLTNTRLRVLLDTAGDPSANTYQLEYKLSTDNWWTKATTTAGEYSAPTFVDDGGFVSGVGALSVPFYAGYQDGDIAVLCVESANQAITTPTGWTQVSSSPQSYGTAGAQNAVRLGVFYKVVSGTQSNVTVADSGDHTSATLYGIRGVATSSPIDVTAGSFDTASSTTLTWPSVTTSVPNDFIFQCAGLDDDTTGGSRLLGASNSNLTNMTLIGGDSTGSGVGGGVGAVYGVMTNPGSIGNSTSVGVSNNRHAYVTIAFRPIIQKILIKSSSNIGSGGTDSTTAQLTPPSGKTTSDFQAGQISDDTNPLPSFDFSSDKYTEFEWNLIATTTAATNDVYQFRITANGTPLTSYSVTPQWTIGTPATPAAITAPRLKLSFGKLLLLGGKLIIQ